jgi:RNA polymerase sigma-70 factor (ECF subfamily)
LSGTSTQQAGTTLADAALERRWLARDRGALGDLHRRYSKKLERVAFRILGNRADAEDVVQQVFLALPRATYRGSASLWSYLYRAAVNGSVNLLRARRRRGDAHQRVLAETLLAEARRTPSPETQVLEGELLAAVARALLEVKPRHRRVLVLRVQHGLSNTEIAEQEGVPLATVGTWLRRGRQELVKALRPLLREIDRRPG